MELTEGCINILVDRVKLATGWLHAELLPGLLVHAQGKPASSWTKKSILKS